MKHAHKYSIPQAYRELATLSESGIAMADAFKRSSFMNYPDSGVILRALEGGSSLSKALSYGSFSRRSDRIHLEVAEYGGFVPSTLKQIAVGEEQRAQHLRRIKTRWLMQLATLAIAWLAGLVVAAFSSEVSFIGKLLTNTLYCGLVLMELAYINRLTQKESWWWLNQCCRWGKLHTPVGQHLICAHWLKLLGHQLKAGIDAAAGLKKMEGMIADANMRHRVQSAQAQVEQGGSLMEALISTGIVSDAQKKSLLITGEKSGRLEEMIDRTAHQSEEALQLQLNEIFFWLPKVVYVFVVVFAMKVIFP